MRWRVFTVSLITKVQLQILYSLFDRSKRWWNRKRKVLSRSKWISILDKIEMHSNYWCIPRLRQRMRIYLTINEARVSVLRPSWTLKDKRRKSDSKSRHDERSFQRSLNLWLHRYVWREIQCDILWWKRSRNQNTLVFRSEDNQ